MSEHVGLRGITLALAGGARRERTEGLLHVPPNLCQTQYAQGGNDMQGLQGRKLRKLDDAQRETLTLWQT